MRFIALLLLVLFVLSTFLLAYSLPAPQNVSEAGRALLLQLSGLTRLDVKGCGPLRHMPPAPALHELLSLAAGVHLNDAGSPVGSPVTPTFRRTTGSFGSTASDQSLALANRRRTML